MVHGRDARRLRHAGRVRRKRSCVTVLTRGEAAGPYAPPIGGEAAAESKDGAMKNQTTRQHLGAALVLAALLFAGAIAVAAKGITGVASADSYGLDILALDPDRE